MQLSPSFVNNQRLIPSNTLLSRQFVSQNTPPVLPQVLYGQQNPKSHTAASLRAVANLMSNVKNPKQSSNPREIIRLELIKLAENLQNHIVGTGHKWQQMIKTIPELHVINEYRHQNEEFTKFANFYNDLKDVWLLDTDFLESAIDVLKITSERLKREISTKIQHVQETESHALKTETAARIQKFHLDLEILRERLKSIETNKQELIKSSKLRNTNTREQQSFSSMKTQKEQEKINEIHQASEHIQKLKDNATLEIKEITRKVNIEIGRITLLTDQKVEKYEADIEDYNKRIKQAPQMETEIQMQSKFHENTKQRIATENEIRNLDSEFSKIESSEPNNRELLHEDTMLTKEMTDLDAAVYENREYLNILSEFIHPDVQFNSDKFNTKKTTLRESIQSGNSVGPSGASPSNAPMSPTSSVHGIEKSSSPQKRGTQPVVPAQHAKSWWNRISAAGAPIATNTVKSPATTRHHHCKSPRMYEPESPRFFASGSPKGGSPGPRGKVCDGCWNGHC